MHPSTKIAQICGRFEDQAEWLAFVQSVVTAEELYALLDHYNWDDGFRVPSEVANHPKCDLAIAVRMYWLAEADFWHGSDRDVNEFNRAHFEFSKLLTDRILSGRYSPGKLSHSEGFNRVQVHKFMKRDFPRILYMPVVGSSA